MADSRRLTELGMVPPLAKEVASQITAGVGNARRLAELSMVPVLAKELADQITAKVGNVRRLAELTMVTGLAVEVASQIQGGGVTPVKRLRPVTRRFANPASLTTGANNHSRPTVYTNVGLVPITEIHVMFTGFAFTASLDINTSQSVDYKFGVEMPLGTKLASSSSFTVLPGGFAIGIISGLNIPVGGQFYINCKGATSGNFPTAFSNSSPARLAYLGADAGDYTIPGSPTQPQGGGNGIIPFSVMSNEYGNAEKCIILTGDSLMAGAVGVPYSQEACIDAGAAFINIAVSGARATGKNLTARFAAAMACGATEIHINDGINDFRNGVTFENWRTAVQAEWALFRSAGIPVTQHTITPNPSQIVANADYSPSNQQPAAFQGQIDLANAYIRSGAGGLIDRVFDASDIISTSRDSGLSKDGYLLNDLLHPSTIGAAQLQSGMASNINGP